MPAGSSSTLALAARLRALDDDTLTALLRRREVRSAGLRDWFDLAEALLDRGSVQAALERLDRPTLAVLAAATDLASNGGAPTVALLAERLGSDPSEVAQRAATAVDAALLGEESGRYAPWDTVAEQLAAWPSFGLPAIDDLIWQPPPPALVRVTDEEREAIDSLAGEHAFTATGRVTELVLELRREPARRLAKGGIALPETRRLAAAVHVDADEVPALLDIAERAGLIADDAAVLAPTAAGLDWVDLPGPERWEALAAGWLERLAPDVRDLLGERTGAVWDDALVDYLSWFYPAGGEIVSVRLRPAAAAAETLGITARATPSTAGRLLLETGPAEAASAMRGRFPAEVDRVYVQDDLTVISPGPLRADLDSRLRGMADAEARGLASTYRVTAGSLTRALTAGETADSVRDFLSGLSLTGIPQPLDYLLRDTASRFGSLRVFPAEHGSGTGRPAARSGVRSDDDALLDQLLVDSSLAVLDLQRSGRHELASRVEAAVLYWSLADARYPAVLEGPDGALVTPHRRAAVAPSATPPRDSIGDLVARLRDRPAAGSEDGDGEAWIARQLELAAKGKAVVVVAVRMPDGSEQEFRLEPASVAGGRLRARDARAGLERTLPLRSITAVTPLT